MKQPRRGPFLEGQVPCSSCSDLILRDVFGCTDCMNTGSMDPCHIQKGWKPDDPEYIEILRAHCSSGALRCWAEDWAMHYDQEPYERFIVQVMVNQLISTGYLRTSGANIEATKKGQAWVKACDEERRRENLARIRRLKCEQGVDRAKVRLKAERDARWAARYDDVVLF